MSSIDNLTDRFSEVLFTISLKRRKILSQVTSVKIFFTKSAKSQVQRGKVNKRKKGLSGREQDMARACSSSPFDPRRF